MSPRATFTCIFLVLVSSLNSAESYELATHGRMTEAAYARLTSEVQFGLFSRIGVDQYSTSSPFGKNYADVSAGRIELRSATTFEEDGGRMRDRGDSLTIKGWLMRGAIREDDVLAGFSDKPVPQDDPYNTGDVVLDNRPLHHFYDPRNDRGLRVGLRIGQKAPDWGIGADDAFADENAADAWRRNHFTVFDAREAMFRALTGMSGSGSRAIGTGGSTPSTAADKLAVRKAYWATTFRALGDIVHLIQDMAQPQHTRNDPHAGKGYEGDAGPLGHKSHYEAYIESRAVQGEVSESNATRSALKALVYDTTPTPYPIPRFNDYVSYFSTRHVQAGVTARKGMADYSNRGFFSPGKNLGQGEYDLPPNSITGGFYRPVPRPISTGDATVHIFEGSVSDAYTNATKPDVALTAFGAWNDALEQATSQQSFSLIRENYDAMANLLIPRAVAYSAGLIDYFFRGRMEIALPDEGVYAILDHAALEGAQRESKRGGYA